MKEVEVIQNNSIRINFLDYVNYRGWEVESSTVAKHYYGNEGYLIFDTQVIPDWEYEVSFNISGITDGTLKVYLGDAESNTITTDGYHQITLFPTEQGSVRVWSDADLTLSNFEIIGKLTQDADRSTLEETIAFNSTKYRWVSFRSYIPESGSDIYTDMITFKDGDLWLHTKDATPNNFYGEQYSSHVKFAVSSIGVKTYQSIAVHSNKVLGTSENGVTTELGDVSDLINYDFTTKEGIHYANLLRDKLTNNSLQGRYIVVDLTDEETKGTKMQIFKVVVKSVINTPSE